MSKICYTVPTFIKAINIAMKEVNHAKEARNLKLLNGNGPFSFSSLGLGLRLGCTPCSVKLATCYFYLLEINYIIANSKNPSCVLPWTCGSALQLEMLSNSTYKYI